MTDKYTAKHVTAKARGTSGWVIRPRPAQKWAMPGTAHIERAAWLASCCEGTPGVVQGWDGAGVSMGPLHFPAVLPGARAQGAAFWQLAQKLATPAFLSLMTRAGWSFGHDNIVVEEGMLGLRAVSWVDMQTEMCGIGGLTLPDDTNEYERAREWCMAASEMTAPRHTHAMQLASAADWLLGGQSHVERLWYLRGPRAQLDEALDLVLCAYHALSVHAPAWAVLALRRAKRGDAMSLSAQLVDEVRARRPWRERRWAVIRSAAAGLWPEPLVRRVLPALD